MKATVELVLDLDPLVSDKKKIEWDLRVALCLLAHEDCGLRVESAPIIKVEIKDLMVEDVHNQLKPFEEE